MGYYASGDGSATLKEGVNQTELANLLDGLPNSDMDFEFYENKISFWENDSHWHEEDTFEFLEALIPYITDGCAHYSGEEDCIWRYKFYSESETWEEESATIDYNFESYTDEELITELVKRGYKVTN